MSDEREGPKLMTQVQRLKQRADLEHGALVRLDDEHAGEGAAGHGVGGHLQRGEPASGVGGEGAVDDGDERKPKPVSGQRLEEDHGRTHGPGVQRVGFVDERKFVAGDYVTAGTEDEYDAQRGGGGVGIVVVHVGQGGADGFGNGTGVGGLVARGPVRTGVEIGREGIREHAVICAIGPIPVKHFPPGRDLTYRAIGPIIRG